MIDFNDKIFNAARRRGYIELAISAPTSFVGSWVIKFKNDLKTLSYFEEITGKHITDWDDMTELNLKSFRDIVSENMSPNSAKTTFSKLKSVLNDNIRTANIPCPQDVYSKILVAKSNPVINTYLNEKEVEALANVEVKSAEEEYVRSLFLISSYTGARHSDAMNLTTNDIQVYTDGEGNVQSTSISYVSKKTCTEANIPVHRNLVRFLNGYDHSIILHDYVYNDILRELCRRAKINSNVKVRHAGIDKIGPKYEFVSSHTARRSFVTNLYLRGVDIETIAKMAGHSDSAMTRRYLCAVRGLGEVAMRFFN